MTHFRPYTVQGPQGTINVLCGKACNLRYNAWAHNMIWRIDVFNADTNKQLWEGQVEQESLTDTDVMLNIIEAYTLDEMEI